MFGAQPQASSSFGGFGTPAASQPPATTSLFGAPATSQPSLFGTPASAGKPNFFSSTPGVKAAASAPPPSTGLFGAPAASTSLFGAPKPATAPGTSLFGASSSAPTTSLFGAPAPAAGAGGGLFGASTSAPLSLFGASAAAPAPVAQAQAPDQKQATTSKYTKYEHLPDAMRTGIDGLQAMITAQMEIGDQLKTKADDVGHGITHTASLQRQYQLEATAVRVLLDEDKQHVDDLRARLTVEQGHLLKIKELVEATQSTGGPSRDLANYPMKFFTQKADVMQEKIRNYRCTMEQIQHQIETSRGAERNPASIVPTLRAQHASLISLASAVATIDAELKVLKDDYRAIFKAKTGFVQDPFVVKRGSGKLENGVERLEIR
ncbi:nucleoporin p58/p45, partial [Phenoliferia sp. Uapishka_3]